MSHPVPMPSNPLVPDFLWNAALENLDDLCPRAGIADWMMEQGDVWSWGEYIQSCLKDEFDENFKKLRRQRWKQGRSDDGFKDFHLATLRPYLNQRPWSSVQFEQLHNTRHDADRFRLTRLVLKQESVYWENGFPSYMIPSAEAIADLPLLFAYLDDFYPTINDIFLTTFATNSLQMIVNFYATPPIEEQLHQGEGIQTLSFHYQIRWRGLGRTPHTADGHLEISLSKKQYLASNLKGLLPHQRRLVHTLTKDIAHRLQQYIGAFLPLKGPNKNKNRFNFYFDHNYHDQLNQFVFNFLETQEYSLRKYWEKIL